MDILLQIKIATITTIFVWPLKYNKYPFAKQQKYAIFHLKNESKVLSKFST